MFSGYIGPADVRVVCFALETSDGQLKWWRPRFYRYSDQLGEKAAVGDAAIKLWCVSEVLRLIRLEEGDATPCRAIHVIERRWVNSHPEDRPLARIPLPASSRAR